MGQSRVLTLPVAKAPFEMLSDPNPETRKNSEYRAMSAFWFSRLLHEKDGHYEGSKQFDLVKFTNGYGHKVPFVVREWKGLTIEKPNPLWVPKGFLDLDQNYFSIQLGEIITAPPSVTGDEG
jgi:hypothetical protein